MNGLQATVIGNITDDPALMYTPNEGKAYLRLTVAANRFTGADTPPDTLFVDFTLWESRAESASVRLSKGDPVYVSGPLLVRTYERKDHTMGVNLSIQPARDFHYMTRGATAAETAETADPGDPAAPTDAAPAEPAGHPDEEPDLDQAQ